MAHEFMRLVVLFLIPLGSYAQPKKIFNIGDSMPPMTFRNIFNKPGTSITLSDYKGKLIIIDFWNRWCGTCIEAFPKMEKLQNEFGERIKILLVTTDKEEDVAKLFKRFKQPALTVISNDSLLSSMFPHVAVPHHVWINPDGRIQFITDGYNATAQNVSKVLEGKDVKLRIKSAGINVDEDSDLWKEGKGRLQKYINNYSFAMDRISEIESTAFTFIRDTINNTCGFKFVNISLLDFYKVAFGGSIDYQNKEFGQNNRIQFNVSGGYNIFEYPDETDSIPAWEERNLICYESKWKLSNPNLAYRYLQDDANRFFPYLVKVENKEVFCYTLKKARNSDSLRSESKEKIFKYTDSSFILKNMPVSIITESLNELALFKNFPVINETNISFNIDVHLINAFNSIATLQRQLLKNGLLLTQEKRTIQMLVINAK